ncbi:amphi-Trp domain-containing protein [Thiomicrospira pelophila]|uniref:amphi-Trp domain-containing protein n=1 Tax=Thiomicrospira pelophila TaxID=934 RepID=UPI000690F58D|nr:amphi-Trp domain-containing protein [Thiomicrospira pelophila]
MAKNTNSFKHESLQDQASVVAYLNLICQSIEKGQIHLANDEDDVTIRTKGLSRLKIKAKQAKTHQELRITLAWSGDTDKKTESNPTLEVTSKPAKNPKKAKKPNKIKKKTRTKSDKVTIKKTK